MGPTSQKLRRSVPYMGRTRPEGAPTRNQFFKITSHLRNGHQARRGVSSCKAECNALSNTHFKQHGEGRGGRVRACSPSGPRAVCARACSPAGAGPCARMRALRRAQGRVRACMLSSGRLLALWWALGRVRACVLSGGRRATCAHACSPAGPGPCARVHALRREQGKLCAKASKGGEKQQGKRGACSLHVSEQGTAAGPRANWTYRHASGKGQNSSPGGRRLGQQH